MRSKKIVIMLLVLSVVLLLSIFGSNKFLPFLVPFVFAHCDTEDGPVVTAAKKALQTGNVDFVLVWVKKDDEAEIKKAFEKTLAVRKLNARAKELADRYFFETVVRIHRAGEGEPYTGIKPAGTEVQPGIVVADKAIETGSVDNLIKEITAQIANAIREHFYLVMEKKKYSNKSVEAGREYVEAYVGFIHYVKSLHITVSGEKTHYGEIKDTDPETHHGH